MKPVGRSWLKIGAVALALLGMGAAIALWWAGPLVFPDGRAIAFPGPRFEYSGVMLSETDHALRATGPLSIGTHQLAIAAIQDEAPLSGGVYLLSGSPARQASTAAVARWTLWTRFIVNGEKSSESRFVYAVMTGSNVSTPTIVVTHAGMLDSICVNAKF